MSRHEHDETIKRVNRGMGYEPWTWRDLPASAVALIRDVLRVIREARQ